MGRGEYEPTLADTQRRWLARCEAAGVYGADTGDVGTGKAVGSSAAGFSGWLRKAEKEVGVAVVGTFEVFQGERVRREELDPLPDARVVFTYLGNAFELLVV